MNKKEKTVDSRQFSQKHPKWNFLISLLFVLGTVAGVIFVVSYIIKFVGQIIGSFLTWVSTIASTLDAVIIVTLITGTVSIAGVIISSIVGKSLEYKKARLEYLAQKREKPYGDFIAMYYKILMSNKTKEKYTQEEMAKDISSFSQELTLWGSNKVVKLWVDYRTKATQLNGTDSLFEFERILYEIRKDMGFKKLKKGTLLKFVVNDLDESIHNLKKS